MFRGTTTLEEWGSATEERVHEPTARLRGQSLSAGVTKSRPLQTSTRPLRLVDTASTAEGEDSGVNKRENEGLRGGVSIAKARMSEIASVTSQAWPPDRSLPAAPPGAPLLPDADSNLIS